MKTYLTQLRDRILSEGVLDSEDVHHEFVSGMHGRKIDMDKIKTGSQFYHQWMDACVTFIQENYDQQPDMILGVANGANRMAVSVAAGLGGGIIGLISEKETSKSSKLHKTVEDVIQGYQPRFLLVIEDVGTKGTTSASAAQKAKEAGAKKVTVLNTWQRNQTLERLDEANIDYKAMIFEPLPNYQPDACRYCQGGSKLIPHD